MATEPEATGQKVLNSVPIPRFRRHGLHATIEPQKVSRTYLPTERTCGAIAERCGDGFDRRVIELLPLVRRVAIKISRQLPAHVEVDDLVGAGVLGLIDAIRKFDRTKQVKLEYYAGHRIRGAILDSLRALDFASRDMRKKNKKVERVHRELQAKLGQPIGDEEMACGLGVCLEKWYRTLHELQVLGVDWLRPTQSLGVRKPVEETLVRDNGESPFDRCYRREQKEILNRVMVRLPERERLIISLYYEQAKTMKQIAAQLGVDESRVSQLHTAALARLRTRVNRILRGPQPTPAPWRAKSKIDLRLLDVASGSPRVEGANMGL